ncbi:thioredoxin reductase [Capsulimonas corticalis]|uniref:Thioredoxin reductase n=1 Tax=Capsulimonas corticalis TaxID=2219043 RepID=A0A402CPR7_9BACT|nr:thioredoxin-disulfide reductase [Capsulimonas corticalis]BDI32912.1 thioredoxin reductase [Capsulimonas corticalis]
MTSIEHDVRNVVIIGSGPAGLTAAIYAARANLNPLVIEGGAPNLPGGQLMITSDVENFPGFAHGIMGPELMDQMRQQAARVGAEFWTENVTDVDFSDRPFHIKTDGDREVYAKTAIVTTGASAKWLGLPSETALYGKGVSACATCDGFFFRNREVIVVGGGDTALEEANYLARMASKVTLVHRRESLRGSHIMQKRAMDNPKIEFAWNSVITEIHDPKEGKVTGVTLHNLKTDEKTFLSTDGLFIAIGHSPNTKLFEGKLSMDPQGYIITTAGRPLTNIPGVYAAGDVQDTLYKQAVTAAGSGCMAAIEAERFLEEEDSHG